MHDVSNEKVAKKYSFKVLVQKKRAKMANIIPNVARVMPILL